MDEEALAKLKRKESAIRATRIRKNGGSPQKRANARKQIKHMKRIRRQLRGK